MVCLPSSKLREVQWLRAVNGHGLHRPRGSGVWGGRGPPGPLRRPLGAGGLLQRCSVGGHWEASVLATWAPPGAGPWRVGGRAPASQLAMWGLWFQGPATRAPQDATGGSGVGSVEEAGEATPSGEQPLLPHHVPRPGDMLLQWTDPTRRTPPRRARHTGAGVRRHGSAGSADIPRPPRDPRVTSPSPAGAPAQKRITRPGRAPAEPGLRPHGLAPGSAPCFSAGAASAASAHPLTACSSPPAGPSVRPPVCPPSIIQAVHPHPHPPINPSVLPPSINHPVSPSLNQSAHCPIHQPVRPLPIHE